MLEIKLTPKAHQDIENIYTYISKDGETIASKQVRLIYKALENLKDFPRLGKDFSKYFNLNYNYRVLSIEKTYLAFYRIEQDQLLIIRILRTSQDYISLLELEQVSF